MNIPALSTRVPALRSPVPQPAIQPPSDAASTEQAAFGDFVGTVFFTQMLSALRSTQGEVAYLGGGQGEKTFQSQLDQQIVAGLADQHGERLASPLRNRIDVRA